LPERFLRKIRRPQNRKQKSPPATEAARLRAQRSFEKNARSATTPITTEKKSAPAERDFKRGTFTVKQQQSHRRNAEDLDRKNGDTLMPPFKDVLDAAEIKT